jgi:hypothetical protein
VGAAAPTDRLKKKAAGRKKRPAGTAEPVTTPIGVVELRLVPTTPSSPDTGTCLESQPKVPVTAELKTGLTVKVVRPGMCDSGHHGHVEKENEMIYVRIISPGPEHGRCYLHSNLSDLEIIDRSAGLKG